jgi:xylulokinase
VTPSCVPHGPRVLVIDLGTSRAKVALLDGSLRPLGESAAGYRTIASVAGMAEQRCEDWIDGVRRSVDAVLEHVDGDAQVDALVLTAQMPTLVSLSSSFEVIGNAVTWQDSRADALVAGLLDESARQRVRDVAGTPIDGRYIVPMHLRRARDERERPASIMSAKDYLYFALTGERVTDPSTASGYGNYSLSAQDWSAELSELWRLPTELLPDIVEPTHVAPLTDAGSAVVGGVLAGTPVFVGAADSVCAHEFLAARYLASISVIDGSSTVIMASWPPTRAWPDHALVTPLVDPRRVGAEMDLLATGSSVGWVASMLGLTPGDVEALTLEHPDPAECDVLFFPYLAGGEQGALWRSDLRGAVGGISLSTTRADLALAVYEGIAFETYRCVKLLQDPEVAATVVSAGARGSRHLGAALLGALLGQTIVATADQSPSLLGAAQIALGVLDPAAASLGAEGAARVEMLQLDDGYAASLVSKAETYFAAAQQFMP